jgi:UPF0755 protein
MTKKKKKKGFSVIKQVALWVFIVLVILAGVAAYKIYSFVYAPNVQLGDSSAEYLYIPTGSTFSEVRNTLIENDFLKNVNSFDWVAEQKSYPNLVKAGRYQLKSGMSNNELVNMLRSGKQQPLNLTFTNIRTKEQLAGHIAERIEADSMDIIMLLNDRSVMKNYGLNAENAALLFIPNTYEFFWNTSAEQLLQRMHREYQKFWTEDRLQQAAVIGLTPQEIGIMASIVQQETIKPDEMDVIAGVYVNRIKTGMPLQADPTIVFANKDFSITRVLTKHLEIDSPYNTYKYRGLPPGPISLPSPAAIESVLYYKKHDYLYFCAKDDFSGYHAFARTYQQHLLNARKYQQELNKRKIMR